MKISLRHRQKADKYPVYVQLPSSKSLSNRYLILNLNKPGLFNAVNLSESDDTENLRNLINQITEAEKQEPKGPLRLRVNEGGTTFRFLLPYLCFGPLKQEFIVELSEQLLKRPHEKLIAALEMAGALIYRTEKGYLIKPSEVKAKEIELQSELSSQYLSAFVLNGHLFRSGIKLVLKGHPPSYPYLKMSMALAAPYGVASDFNYPELNIHCGEPYIGEKRPELRIESDWSAAAYWYAMAALLPMCQIKMQGLEEGSMQGDSLVRQIFTFFGVNTLVNEGYTVVEKKHSAVEEFIFDCGDTPDLVPLLAVLCSLLEIKACFESCQTLLVKESNRISALQTELSKIGCKTSYTSDGRFCIDPSGVQYEKRIDFSSHADHRLAMALTLVAVKAGEIIIDEAESVAKSYPGWWQEVQKPGFSVAYTS